eukprot:gene3501-3959_t
MHGTSPGHCTYPSPYPAQLGVHVIMSKGGLSAFLDDSDDDGAISFTPGTGSYQTGKKEADPWATVKEDGDEGDEPEAQ